ncbi:hypothetical protein [Bradyrhizobium sp. DASA03120]|uniref:hypothetical protein n=1 Tax=Bradyrhizobium sp. SMVTL-02 TaxID=3395917 RepID=UPI003F7136B7
MLARNNSGQKIEGIRATAARWREATLAAEAISAKWKAGLAGKRKAPAQAGVVSSL